MSELYIYQNARCKDKKNLLFVFLLCGRVKPVIVALV